MKRALSIAQYSQALNNGDYFGYDATSNVPTIGWSQWQVGTNYAPGGTILGISDLDCVFNMVQYSLWVTINGCLSPMVSLRV